MKYLDLCCGAGGAAVGIKQADPEAEIVGVDIIPQRRYPFTFIQGDALTFPLDGFDFIWASPPCQGYSNTQRIQGNDHPKLIEAIRQRLLETGKPYCIENVEGAPLLTPITLCGAMFGLKVYRHRLFETNFSVKPLACQHSVPQVKMGRPVKEGDIIQVVGHFSNTPYARKAMGIDWMMRDELAQAIPPAFSKYILEQYKVSAQRH